VTMNLRPRWLERLRRGQAKVADRVTGDAASGRVSRRDLIRGGTVAGLSVPVAGSILAARGSGSSRPAKAGAPGSVTLDSDVQVAQSVLGIPGGGTGQTTAPAAFAALAPTGGTASGQLMLNSSLVSAWVPAVVNAQAYGAKGNGTADDTAAIQSAVSAVTGGGMIFLPAGTYKVTSTITVPWNNILVGSGPGTVVSFTGSGDVFRMQNANPTKGVYSTQQNQSGGFRDLLIDGNGTAGALAGIHIGDGLGYELSNIFIRNFTGTNGVGLHVDNNIWWTEKMRGRHIVTSNCTTHVLMEKTGTGTDSLAYSEYDIHMYIASATNLPAQTGLVIQGGVNPYANRFWLTGNVEPGASSTTIPTFMSITGTDGATSPSASKIQDSLIFIRAETSATTSYNPETINFGLTPPSPPPWNIITNCFGEMIFAGPTNGGWVTSNAVAGNLFSFRGIISEETTTNPQVSALQVAQGTESVPTAPPLSSGKTFTNTNTTNVQVIISGGTVQSIELTQDGSLVTTGLTSGTFFLPPGGQITVTYSGSTTWQWIRAAT
jgi:hypothetical protein